MGDIVDRIEDNLKDTPNKRIGDVNILYLAGVVEDLKKKMENGLTLKVDRIWQKVNTLPCDVHSELIKKNDEIRELRIRELTRDIKDAPKQNRTLINWLFGLYGTTVALIIGVATTIVKIFKQ